MELINGILQAEDDGLILEIMAKYPPYYKSSDRAKWPRINGRLGVGGSGSGSNSLAFSDFTSSFTGINRTVINANGNQITLPAGVVAIDHVGTSLTPMLRVEPAAANILLEVLTSWTDTTLTPVLNATSWAGVANGAYTVTASGANGTLMSSAVSATSAAFTFVCAIKRKTGTGAVSMTIDNGATWTAKTLTTSFQYFNVTKTAANPQLGFKLATSGDAIIVDCLMLIPNTALASSYFAGAAAIGAELVTDGGFAAVVDNVGELATGVLTVGNCYKISAHTDTDFTTVGAPDSNVGTYFNATATGGAGILDAGDKVFPVTFTNWTVESGLIFAPQATAGSLTGKASVSNTSGSTKVAYQAVALSSSVNRYVSTATITSGSYAFRTEFDGTLASARHTATGTYYDYKIITGAYDNITLDFPTISVMVLDDVSVKEHGTVRLSEANTVTLAMPAAVTAMLAAGTGTIVIKGRFAFARAAGVVTNILAATAATNSLVYTTTAAGNITSNDGTTIAENTGAYTANTDWKIALKFPSDTDKYRIGIDVAGAGIVCGTEVAFDGDFTTGANLILGYVLHGATWIKWVKFFDKVLTNDKINSLA